MPLANLELFGFGLTRSFHRRICWFLACFKDRGTEKGIRGKKRKKERLNFKINVLNIVSVEIQSNISKMEQIIRESKIENRNQVIMVMPYYNLSMFTMEAVFTHFVEFMESDPEIVNSVSRCYAENCLINRMLDMLIRDFSQVVLFNQLLGIINAQISFSMKSLNSIKNTITMAEKELQEFI